jgi:hypothetical protein
MAAEGISLCRLYQSAARNPFLIFLVHLVVHFKRFEATDKVQAVVKINIFLHGQVCHLVFRFSSAACGFSFTTIK